ncbi:MAG: DUF2970 domain-containing protein [Cellvibrionaceae bacterium]
MTKSIPDKKANKPNFWQIALSTIAAAFGVQSRKNHENDFKHGNIYTYIAAGLIFTCLFVFAVIFVVHLVLKSSGL